MKFTLLGGFGAGHAKPLVFAAGCWGSGAPGTSSQLTAFERWKLPALPLY
jgi:hypothetical protein